jgi:hypothetical protein
MVKVNHIKHIMDMCKMLLAKYNTQYYTRQPHQQSCYSALSDDQIDPPGSPTVFLFSPTCSFIRVRQTSSSSYKVHVSLITTISGLLNLFGTKVRKMYQNQQINLQQL